MLNKTENRNAIVKKLQALLQMKNFGTENEAINAAARISEILTKYDMSLDDVNLPNLEDIIEEHIDTGRSTFSHPLEGCLRAISLFCDCKSWRSRKYNKETRKYEVKFVLFGQKQDIEISTYLYHVIENAMQRELKTFHRDYYYKFLSQGKKKVASNEFRRGMASRISERLQKMREERSQEVKESTGKDLVVLKKNIVEDAFRRLNVHLKTTNKTSTNRIDPQARNAGYTAGDNVRFHRGVASGKSGPLALTR